MATRNIVPRANGEGSIGTAVKHWGNGYFDELNTDLIVPKYGSTNNSVGAADRRWKEGYFEKLVADDVIAKGPVVDVRAFGAVGDGVHDDTAAIQAAIDNSSAVIIPTGRYKVTSTIYLHSDLILLGTTKSKIISSNIVNVFKAIGPETYNNITISGIEFDNGKSVSDDVITVAIQLYNVANFKVTNCVIRHASAGIGLDNCADGVVSQNLFEGLYQQTMTATEAAGVYGYGITVVSSANIIIANNHLGTLVSTTGTNPTTIDRHAIYVSVNATGTNSERVLVVNNSICMKSYTSDEEAVTGFEFALKTIDGNDIHLANNICFGGFGAVFLNYKNGTTGKITIEGNTFINCLKSGVKIMPFDVSSYDKSIEHVVVKDNTFNLTGTYATGVAGMGTKKYDVTNNVFISTNNIKQSCYYIKTNAENNQVQADYFYAKNNTIKNFKGIGNINNVTSLKTDDCVYAFDNNNFVPFAYTENVSRKSNRISFLNAPYDIKKVTSGYTNGIEYTDEILGVITCNDGKWYNLDGLCVAGTSAQRPTVGLYAGYKFYEIDNDRIIYWTGAVWSTTGYKLPTYGTKAEILALDSGYLSYGYVVYCTDDKKPYWFDAWNQVFKDANGAVLA